VSGIDSIAVRVECRARRVESLCRPAEVSGHECDLRLSDDAPRASEGFCGTKGARRTPQQSLGSIEITQLRHGDPAKRERRGIVSEGDALQRAQRIARCKCMCRGGDQ
jgi:hypothetical protein